MKNKKRIQRLLSEYGPVIGTTEAEKREHLFYVKNQEIDNPSGEFVLGHVIGDLIRDDCYEIIYLGLHRAPDKAKFAKCKRTIERDLEAGRVAKQERNGVFADTVDSNSKDTEE